MRTSRRRGKDGTRWRIYPNTEMNSARLEIQAARRAARDSYRAWRRLLPPGLPWRLSDSRRPAHHDRPDRSCRPRGGCHLTAFPVSDHHPHLHGCHSSRHQGRPRLRRRDEALGLGEVADSPNRPHCGSRPLHHSTGHHHNRGGRRSLGPGRSYEAVARNTGAVSSNAAPGSSPARSNNVARSNKPRIRRPPPGRRGGSRHPRSRHCKQAAYRSLARSSLHSNPLGTTSSERKASFVDTWRPPGPR